MIVSDIFQILFIHDTEILLLLSLKGTKSEERLGKQR